eukprot:6459064-Amphidinium_carterae.1
MMYLQWLVGGDSGKSLKDIWKDECMASPDEDLETVMKQSKSVLQMSRGFAVPSIQAEIEAADAMLTAMAAGEKLMSSSKVRSWVTNMATLMEQRVMWKEESKETKETITTRGMAALQSILNHHKQEGKKTTSVDELKWLSVFRHKLTAAETATVSTWRANILKASKTMEKPVATAKPKKTHAKQQKS